MTKSQLSTANHILTHSCELLIRQVAEYEQEREGKVLLTEEDYRLMVDTIEMLNNKVERLNNDNFDMARELVQWRLGK